MARTIRRWPFAALFLVLVIIGAGNTALTSVTPAIGRSLGLPDVVVAAILSLSALLWAAMSPFWAEVSDRRGRKPLILLGMFGFAVSMLLFGLAVVAGLAGLLTGVWLVVTLTLARSLFGLLGSATPAAAQALLADNSSPSERMAALTVFASALGLGTVLGPAVAPLFTIPPLGLPGPIFAFSLTAALGGVIAWRVLARDVPIAQREAVGEKRSGLRLWRDPLVGPFLIFGFAMTSAQALNFQSVGFLVLDTIPLMPEHAQVYVGGAMMAGAAAGLVAQWALIKLWRPSPGDLLKWGAAIACLANLVLAFAASFWVVGFAYCLASVGYAVCRPGFTTGASLAVGPADQGAVAGQLNALIGAAFIFAPVIGMGLYQLRPQVAFLTNAALLLALVAYRLANPVLKGVEAPAAVTPG